MALDILIIVFACIILAISITLIHMFLINTFNKVSIENFIDMILELKKYNYSCILYTGRLTLTLININNTLCIPGRLYPGIYINGLTCITKIKCIFRYKNLTINTIPNGFHVLRICYNGTYVIEVIK